MERRTIILPANYYIKCEYVTFLKTIKMQKEYF